MPKTITELSDVNSKSLPTTTSLLNIAVPESLMSSVRAVIAEPPSSPLNKISLSCTPDVITASLELLDIVR